MMRLLALLLLTLLVANSLQAQPTKPASAINEQAIIKVLYRLTFQPDSLNPTKKLQEDFKLLLSKNTSLFVSANRPKRDSAMAKVSEQLGSPTGGNVSLVDIPKTWFSFYVYKARTKQETTTFEQILTSHYRIEETSTVLQWQILPDTQRVAGYACRKATVAYGGRQWHVWFTSEVPVSDGPYKFSGLPGLIVKAWDKQGFYQFELITLTSLRSGPYINTPTWSTRSATREQFRQMQYNYKLNPFAFMDTHGDPVSTADQQVYRERSKTRNNAIERR